MFVTGPDVIKTVTHEEVTIEELGGAETHARTSGVAHFAAESEEECLAGIRELMSFLPPNNLEDPPVRPTARSRRTAMDEALETLVPDKPNKPYDIKELIADGGGRAGLLRGAGGLRAEHRRRVRPARRPARRDRGQPARAPRRGASTSRLAQGRAVRALLRLLQHPARDVRGRARASCRAPRRSTAASSSTAPSCSTPSPRRRCPRSPSSRARPTAARTA